MNNNGGGEMNIVIRVLGHWGNIFSLAELQLREGGLNYWGWGKIQKSIMGWYIKMGVGNLEEKGNKRQRKRLKTVVF